MEESYLLDSLAACSDSPNLIKMFFAVPLVFVNYFDNWTDSIILTIDLDISEDEHILLLVLQDLSSNTSKLVDKPTYLRDLLLH